MPDQTQQGFPNGVDLRGGTIWTKWSKTARKFQNWHFWVKTVGRGGGGGGEKPIFQVVGEGGSPQPPSLPLEEILPNHRHVVFTESQRQL